MSKVKVRCEFIAEDIRNLKIVRYRESGQKSAYTVRVRRRDTVPYALSSSPMLFIQALTRRMY